MSRALFFVVLLGAAQIAGVLCLVVGSTAVGIAMFAISHSVFLYGTLKPASQLYVTIHNIFSTKNRDPFLCDATLRKE